MITTVSILVSVFLDLYSVSVYETESIPVINAICPSQACVVNTYLWWQACVLNAYLWLLSGMCVEYLSG